MAKGERHPRGGMYFEDFEPGKTIAHGLRRTVTQMDNMLFSNMSLNPQPLHIDADFCANETQWGRPLMNSLFTLGLMIGISVGDTTVGTTIGNLGMTDVKFPAPLFEGDTVRVETEVVSKREFEIASRCRARRVLSPRLQAGRHVGRRMQTAGFHAETAGCLRAPRFVGRGAGISPACAATFSMTLGSPSRRKSEIEMKRMPAGSAACGAAAV